MKPAEKFQEWRVEIDAELVEARAVLVDANAAMVKAEKALASAVADQKALRAALEPLEQDATNYFTGRRPPSSIPTSLLKRARDGDDAVRRAKGLVTQSAGTVEYAQLVIAELEQSAAALDRLKQVEGAS